MTEGSRYFEKNDTAIERAASVPATMSSLTVLSRHLLRTIFLYTCWFALIGRSGHKKRSRIGSWIALMLTSSYPTFSLCLFLNSCLSSLLQKHAPVRSKVITVRPPNHWVSAEVLYIRRKCRSVECPWRYRKKRGIALEVDREIVRNILKVKRLLLKKEKTSFLNEKIA